LSSHSSLASLGDSSQVRVAVFREQALVMSETSLCDSIPLGLVAGVAVVAEIVVLGLASQALVHFKTFLCR
jgi:hypothetical protein